MNRWTLTACLAAAVAVLGSAAPTHAAGGFLWYYCDDVWGSPDAWALIDRAPNRANVFPHGGYTAYEGTPGSGFPSYSDYSHINYLHTPAATAKSVQARLDALGLLVPPPEPMFLGKNPKAAEGVVLPRPKEKAKKKDGDK